MIRTIIVLVLAAFGTLSAFSSAFNALLYYMWVAHFRPESWAWTSFVANLNLSMIAGGMTMFATLISSERRLRFDWRTILVLVFLIQNLVSTSLSPYFDQAWSPFLNFAKLLAIVYVIPSLTTDLSKLRMVFLVIALSLGFEGAKQGWATLILHPGAKNANEVAHLGDNNAVAVGMLMVVAMLTALASTATRRWERHLFQFLALGIVYRALSTYSRGGLLACTAMGMWFLVRSKRRTVALVSIVLTASLILPILPPAFWDRMSTMNDARQDLEKTADGSMLGRLHFWQVAIVMANHNPLTGIGNFAFNAAYDRYDDSLGEYGEGRSVHSSWFGTLAELGYPGLITFVLTLLTAFMACFKARRAAARGAPKELESYALALEMGLVAFVVGGTFVPMQYNELVWHFIGLSMALNALALDLPREAVVTSRDKPFDHDRAVAPTVAWEHA